MSSVLLLLLFQILTEIQKCRITCMDEIEQHLGLHKVEGISKRMFKFCYNISIVIIKINYFHLRTQSSISSPLILQPCFFQTLRER